MAPSKADNISDDPKLEVKELWPDGVFEPISFPPSRERYLDSGQLGSGAGEVLASIAGALQSRSGSLTLTLKPLPKSPSHAIKKIAYCSSDRKRWSFSWTSNI